MGQPARSNPAALHHDWSRVTDLDWTPLDAFARLLLLSDVQRERWVDVRIVGLTCAQVAVRDGVTKNAVWLSVTKSDELLAGHAQAVAA